MSTVIADEFGSEVRSLRMFLGMTLADVAACMGVSTGFMSDIERGRRHLKSVSEVINLAAILEAPESADFLIGLAAVDRGFFRISTVGLSETAVAVLSRLALNHDTISDETWIEIEKQLDRSSE